MMTLKHADSTFFSRGGAGAGGLGGLSLLLLVFGHSVRRTPDEATLSDPAGASGGSRRLYASR